MARAPTLTIDRGGALVRADNDARELLKGAPGRYRTHRAGGVMFLILDEETGTAAREGEELALAGDVRHMPLLGLMNLLGQSRETGRLVIQQADVERVIVLKTGDVASVGSNLTRDRLGNFLVRLGRVTEDDLERAQVTAQQQGLRIGQVLVQWKLIEAHELWGCIQEQITELFAEVTSWTEGSFVLYRVAPDHVFPQTPPMSMQGLLLEAVRRQDEMSLFRERIPSVTTRLSRTQKPPRADLPDEERQALDALGAGASVAELARALQQNEFDATRTAYQLLKAGLIEIAKAKKLPKLELTDGDRARVYLYNLAFKEILDEVSRHGQTAMFLASVRKYLADPNGVYAKLLNSVTLDDAGALGEAGLSEGLAQAALDGREPSAVLTEALNELTFFMLFQTGELLDPKSDENLGRRVRLIHASLPTAAR